LNLGPGGRDEDVDSEADADPGNTGESGIQKRERCMNRRTCLVRTGLSLSAGVLGSCLQAQALTNQPSPMLDDWEKVRNQFNLSQDFIHMSSFFLTSHPKPVRDAIEAHRRQLDENPIQ
jgi:hypothetical protein